MNISSLSRRRFVAGSLAVVAGCRPKRGAGFPGYAFVANEDGKAIAAVDLTAFAVTRYIPIQGNPSAVVAHPARPFVYALTPADATVHEIAAGELRFRRSFQASRAAISMRVAPDGSAIWLLSRDPRELVRLSLNRFRADERIGLPADPFDFDIASNGSMAAVSFGPDASIAFVDLTWRRLARQVKLGGATGILRFRSDDRCVLAANLGQRMLSVIEAPGGRVITHLPLAVRPDNFCVKADGGQLFITGDGMDAVVVVYPHRTPQVAETVLAARAPGAMAASGATTGPDGSSIPDYLFIASPQSGDVSIMNIENRKVIAVAAVGSEPAFLTITPDQQYALVLNRRSGDMAVIRVASIVPRRARIPSPLYTMIPVGSKPVSAAVHAV